MTITSLCDSTRQSYGTLPCGQKKPEARLAHPSEIEDLANMRWDPQIGILESGRVRQMKILCNEEPVSYAEVIERWQGDGDFREFFIALLAEAPYDAYFWETPPITKMAGTTSSQEPKRAATLVSRVV